MLALKAHYDGRTIILDEPVHLPVNRPLVLHIQSEENPTAPTAVPSVLEWIAQHPIEEDSLPADLSVLHDHYLYGTPKRTQ